MPTRSPGSQTVIIATIIASVAPQVTTGPGTVLIAGGVHAIQAAFTDPGALDAPWTYLVSWGDGTRNATGSSATTGALNLTHTYKQAGSYRVRITVTDKDGGLGSGEYPVTVMKRGGHS